MTISNETPVTLGVLGGKLEAGESREYADMMHNTFYVESEIGGCTITTQCGIRSFINYGKLIAKESSKRDKRGLKEIIITAVN